jgi:hypothetical protein
MVKRVGSGDTVAAGVAEGTLAAGTQPANITRNSTKMLARCVSFVFADISISHVGVYPKTAYKLVSATAQTGFSDRL